MAEELTAERKKHLEELIRRSQELEKEIDRAERAGIDVAEQRRRFRESQARIARLKAVYLEGK